VDRKRVWAVPQDTEAIGTWEGGELRLMCPYAVRKGLERGWKGAGKRQLRRMRLRYDLGESF